MTRVHGRDETRKVLRHDIPIYADRSGAPDRLPARNGWVLEAEQQFAQSNAYPPKLKGTWSRGKGAHGASSENFRYACSPTANISISTNPKFGVSTATTILNLSGDLTSPSTLFKVIPKNLAPDSNSSIIWNFTVEMAASFAPALESKSFNAASGFGVGVGVGTTVGVEVGTTAGVAVGTTVGVGVGATVGVGSAPHAAVTNSRPITNPVIDNLRRNILDKSICLSPWPCGKR